MSDEVGGPIECRSEEGIVIGLIDAMITCARVAAERIRRYDEDEWPNGVAAACSDLFFDKDVRFVTSFGGNRDYEPNEFSRLISDLRKDIPRVTESAAKIAALENQLSESKAEHGKTLLLLNIAAYETIPALERRCLIVEQAVVGFTRSPKSWLDAAEEFLIAEGKLPQIEVKP